MVKGGGEENKSPYSTKVVLYRTFKGKMVLGELGPWFDLIIYEMGLTGICIKNKYFITVIKNIYVHILHIKTQKLNAAYS